MANNNKEESYDIFIGQSVYPDPHFIFSHQHKSLEEVKDQCLVVFDTNALLAPYSVGEANLLDQCRDIFRLLTKDHRLFIPAQVAREFAKHRAGKLTEIYQQLSQKKERANQIQSGKYPLLNPLETYQKAVNLEKQINTLVQEYRKTLDTLLSTVQDWYWNDPVSMLYREFFSKENIIEALISNDEIKRDLERRLLHVLPPGFKDAGKDDKGVGDLIIWHTILELAEQHHSSVIFVSFDVKTDWFYKSEKLALYPRYELIDEFRQRSGGESLHIIKLSRFLDIFGASKLVVQDVQREEDKIYYNGLKSYQAYNAELAIRQWAIDKFPGKLKNSEGDIDVDFRIEDDQNHKKGFSIINLHKGHIFAATTILAYSKYKKILGLDELFVVLVLNEDGIPSTKQFLEPYLTKEEGVHYILGFVNEFNDFVVVVDLSS